MKMKRVFSSLMALGLATTLVACGGDTDSAKKSKDDSKTKDSATEDKKDDSQDADNADDKTADGKEGEQNAADQKELEDFDAQTSDDTIVLGIGEFSGDFLEGWQNNISDVQVRRLLGIEGNNGYRTVVQDETGAWVNNKAVLEEDPKVTDNEDGSRTYTYKIKKGLKWSDGKEITADDYLYDSLIYSHPSFIPVTGSTRIGSNALKGYEDYHLGKSDTFEGLKKIDDYTFESTIDSSFLPYYEEVSLAALDPLPLHVVSENLILNEEGNKLVAKDGYEPSEEEKQKYKDSLQEQIDNLDKDFEENNEKPADDASEDEKSAYDEAKKEHDDQVKELEDRLNGDVDPTQQLLEQAMLNITNEYRLAPSVVCGPYVFDEYKNNMVKLSLNPNYAGNFKGEKATIPHIIAQYVNQNIAVDLVENGDIDVWEKETDGGKIDQIRSEADAGKIKYNTYERNGYGSINFLTDRGNTKYKEVRQAIAHLIDRNSFVQSYAGGYGVVTNGMYGTSQWMYQDRGADLEGKLTNYQLNIDKANELLDKTPYKFESDGKTAWDKAKAEEAFNSDADNFDYYRYDENGKKLVVNQYGSDESPITTLISNQLPNNAKQAGMEYNVTAGSFATLLQYYYTQEEDPEYTAFNMGQDFGTPFDPWYQYNSKGNDNKTHTNDPKADELTVKLRQTDPKDKEGYLDNWEDFELWYNDYLPEIPLYSNQYHTAYANRVQGFDVSTPTWGFSDQINALSLEK